MQEERPKKPLNHYFKLRSKLMEQFHDSGLTNDQKKAKIKDAWENCSAAEKEKEKKIYDDELAVYHKKIEEYEKIYGKKPKKHAKNDSSPDSVEKPKKSKGKSNKSIDKSIGKNKKKEEKKEDKKDREESKRDDPKSKKDSRKDESPKKPLKKK